MWALLPGDKRARRPESAKSIAQTFLPIPTRNAGLLNPFDGRANGITRRCPGRFLKAPALFSQFGAMVKGFDHYYGLHGADADDYRNVLSRSHSPSETDGAKRLSHPEPTRSLPTGPSRTGERTRDKSRHAPVTILVWPRSARIGGQVIIFFLPHPNFPDGV